MSRRVLSWIAAGGALLTCSGCGFKGPLYLPERNTTVVTHPAESAAAAPAAKKKAQTSPGASQSPGSTPPLPQ
jgi:predicted small lipoprotein YifL